MGTKNGQKAKLEKILPGMECTPMLRDDLFHANYVEQVLEKEVRRISGTQMDEGHKWTNF